MFAVRRAVMIVAAMLAFPSAAQAATVHTAPGHLRPLVLVIHGGAFVAGAPADMAPVADALRAQGMATRLVSYRLGAPAVATADVVAQVRRMHRRWPGRSISAWGGSAGGTIALELAQRGLVSRVVAVAPPTDLNAPVWGQPSSAYWPGTFSQNVAASPRRPHVPTLLIHATDDVVIPVAETEAFAHRYGLRLVERATGNHVLTAQPDPAGLRFVTNH